MAKKPMTLKAYQKTAADRAEDKRNAANRGESVAKWKRTPEAVSVDKKAVKAINRRRGRG